MDSLNQRIEIRGTVHGGDVSAPRCEACGNDGAAGALYLTVDFRWRPASSSAGAWEAVEREDSGGGGFDCLACDHQTQASGAAARFPYGAMISPPDASQPGGAGLASPDLDGECPVTGAA